MAEVYKSSRSINTASGGGQKNSYSASRNGQRPSNSNQMNSSQKSTPNKKALSPQQENAIKKQQENDPNNPNNQDLNMQQKLKKKAAKETLTTAAKAYNPAVGKVVEKALETKKGDEYLDEFAKADSTREGVKNVVKKANNERKKTQRMLFLASIGLPILLFLFVFVLLFAKNADSQTYSNVNDGEVIIEEYDDEIQNVFLKYPGLYEKVEKEFKKVADKYKVDLDRYLIISALVAPLENEFIVPVEGDCGSETKECYYFKGKLYNWEDFISLWAEQTELLAKMQILSYIDKYSSNIKVECGSDETMEQFAKNDLSQGATSFWSFLDIFNLFGSYRDEVDAELNARCIEARPGESTVPDVYVVSTEQGVYYNFINAKGEHEYVKEPDTGGVFFWNLVNQDGFVDIYFKDYLANIEGKSEDELYEINLPKILDIANYIYTYYESIRRDCNGYPVIEGELEKIKFTEDGSSPMYTLDFEDVFVGGSVLATFGGSTGEVAHAQAMLTRSYAYSAIVVHGGDHITGSAQIGCWWWKYNPTYDPNYENQEDNPNYDPDYPKEHFPEIYKAVTDTRGVVITEYGSDVVLETEYDAFCPVTREPQNGFYYLPDGQRNLPIDLSRFSVPQSRVECPCFQNNDSQPGTQYAETQESLYGQLLGKPPQTTTATCWEPAGSTKTDPDTGKTLNGYKYHATGGHGRGVSQHGMKYFSQFGYNAQGLIKLFLERDGYGVTFKRYEGSIDTEKGECVNYLVEKKK